MKLLFAIIAILTLSLSCSTSKSTSNSFSVQEGMTAVDTFPIIKWELPHQDLGKVKYGETRDLIYNFENTGSSPLIIEVVTSCKCTYIDWPRREIMPGEKGFIKVTYDSNGQKLGKLTKTIDVVANTNPIVVEAFFDVEVVE